ncbi:MAG: hypothetical protein ABIO45_13870 [Burkholderiaceae bacterium]
MVRIRTLARPAGGSATAQANRRRQLVFFGVLAVSMLASLGYVFQRPALYLATARWQFVFPESNGAAEPASSAGASTAFLTELQVVTSRPMLEKLSAALGAGGASPGSHPGADSVDVLQRSIDVRPLPGTTIVEVRAVGPRPAPLPQAINTLFDLYRRQLDERYQERSGDDHVKARAEADALAAKVAQQRSAINAFRQRHAIVSGERDENEVLAQYKGQSTAFNTANDKRVAAEARLQALREATASGRVSQRARENPALQQLEQRYAQARDEMRTLERSYTEAYMTLDPNAKALRARVASLEEQLGQARQAAQQAALAEAEIDASAARAATAQLSGQMSSARRGVQDFSARMAEHRSMQEDLDRLEKLRGAAETRATALEAGSRRIAPSVVVLEPAATPQQPWQPDYQRDAVVAVAGSIAAAVLALGVLALLHRPDPPPLAVLMPPPAWDEIDTRPWVQQRSLGPARAGFALGPAPSPPVGLIPLNPLPRELDDGEITALLDAAAPAMRAVLVALLCGLQDDEVMALDRCDLDPASPALRLADRQVPLTEPLLAQFLTAPSPDADAPDDAPLLTDPRGQRLGSTEIDASVVFAAHDAGLARAFEVTPASLRHTFVAHLVRQGARFADLARWTGKIALADLTPYGSIAPATPKRSADQIDPLLPALRRWV